MCEKIGESEEAWKSGMYGEISQEIKSRMAYGESK